MCVKRGELKSRAREVTIATQAEGYFCYLIKKSDQKPQNILTILKVTDVCEARRDEVTSKGSDHRYPGWTRGSRGAQDLVG